MAEEGAAGVYHVMDEFPEPHIEPKSPDNSDCISGMVQIRISAS